MLKAELRQQKLAERKALSLETVDNLSRQIADNFIESFNLDAIRRIHIFLPISKTKEINTHLLIRKLREAKPDIQLIIPRIAAGEGSMEHFLLENDTVLIENKWGIPEPVNAKPFDETPDIVFVPLLAFDFDGNRVGYGKGYYDRYLYTLPANVQKTGLSLNDPVELIDDCDEFDIPLDSCITPKRIFQF